MSKLLKVKQHSIIIATDDIRVAELAESFHAQVCMTNEHHATGTDRLAEVVDKMGYPDDEIVVNVQGDEPLIPPHLIDQVANDLAEKNLLKLLHYVNRSRF